MQKQDVPSLTQAQLVSGPVEIDAQLLKFIGGGAPKSTWGEEPSAAAAATTDDTDPAPKSTW